MALSQSALSELRDAIRAGGSVDVMRGAMTLVLQELIELEAAQAIGAGRYERTDERTTHRNGSRSRLLPTKAGDLDLRIPKFRAGSFLPTLLEPRRRIDGTLWAVVMEAYVHGISTRKVDDLVAARDRRQARAPVPGRGRDAGRSQGGHPRLRRLPGRPLAQGLEHEPLERVNKEIKRRTDVVGIFPNEQAVLRLARAVLLEVHDEWAIADGRYLAEGSMALLDRAGDDRSTKEVERAKTVLLAS